MAGGAIAAAGLAYYFLAGDSSASGQVKGAAHDVSGQAKGMMSQAEGSAKGLYNQAKGEVGFFISFLSSFFSLCVSLSHFTGFPLKQGVLADGVDEQLVRTGQGRD